jgi:hypothetical protein
MSISNHIKEDKTALYFTVKARYSKKNSFNKKPNHFLISVSCLSLKSPLVCGVWLKDILFWKELKISFNTLKN